MKPSALAALAALWVVAWLLLFTVYQDGLHGGFLFDDFPNIVDNPAVHLKNLTPAALRSSLDGPAAGPFGRPVSVLSFALTDYFFGLYPYAFKAVNLAIHAINGLLAWLLVTLILVRAGSNALSPAIRLWLPLWTCTIWLLHPINSVPILLSVQRMTELSAMFVMLALISHLKFLSTPSHNRRALWLILGWLVCWPLAILSKETGALFPVLAALVTLLHKPSRITLPSRQPIRSWTIVLLSLAGCAILLYLGRNWILGGYSVRTFSLDERMMTESRVVWIYVRQILLPSFDAYGLFLDDIPISTNLTHPVTTLFAVAAWSIVIVSLPFAWRRWQIPAFGVAWFLAAHSMESTFLPLEIAQEYRNYLPSLGLLLSAGWLAAHLLTWVKLDLPRISIGLAALFPIAIMSSYTFLRAQQWADTDLGMQIETMHHPNSSRANYSAAQSLFRNGHGDASDPIGGKMIKYHFVRAGELDHSCKFPYLGLIAWACASGRPVEDAWEKTLALRLKNTTYAPIDLELPQSLLKNMLNVPACLDRKTVLSLFEAGANNPRVTPSLHANFLEAAADYEVLVWKDPVSAYHYLERAHTVAPGNTALNTKIDSFASTLEALRNSSTSNHGH